ncbi:MAG: type I 3-dehydroquinate dehydratase [Thermoplasmataceae archaeon]|jgi:3-dehydroquinate dehydratase
MKRVWNEISIGGKKLSPSRKSVITSLYADDSESMIDILRKDMDLRRSLIEVRYDLFQERSIRDVDNLLAYLSEKSIDYVFTYRGSENYLEYYQEAFRFGAPCVDIDNKIARSIRVPNNTIRMVSYHGNEGSTGIENICNSLALLDPDIFKVAIKYDSEINFYQDLISLISFFAKSDRPLCFSPMGSSGFMRIIAAFSVSDIVYASYGNKRTAEGQLSVKDCKTILKYI